jgi:hypothetical protein
MSYGIVEQSFRLNPSKTSVPQECGRHHHYDETEEPGSPNRDQNGRVGNRDQNGRVGKRDQNGMVSNRDQNGTVRKRFQNGTVSKRPEWYGE